MIIAKMVFNDITFYDLEYEDENQLKDLMMDAVKVGFIIIHNEGVNHLKLLRDFETMEFVEVDELEEIE
jgi:hypothetical protein